MTKSWLEEKLEKSPSFAETLKEVTFIEDAADQIHEALDESGVPPSELSVRLGTSKPNVSQMLSGKRNLTLRTFYRIGRALGYEVEPPKFYRAAAESVSVVESRGIVSIMQLVAPAGFKTTQKVTVPRLGGRAGVDLAA